MFLSWATYCAVPVRGRKPTHLSLVMQQCCVLRAQPGGHPLLETELAGGYVHVHSRTHLFIVCYTVDAILGSEDTVQDKRKVADLESSLLEWGQSSTVRVATSELPPEEEKQQEKEGSALMARGPPLSPNSPRPCPETSRVEQHR